MALSIQLAIAQHLAAAIVPAAGWRCVGIGGDYYKPDYTPQPSIMYRTPSGDWAQVCCRRDHCLVTARLQRTEPHPRPVEVTYTDPALPELVAAALGRSTGTPPWT